MFDLSIGFLVKNYIFCQLDMSRFPEFGPNMTQKRNGRKKSATGIGKHRANPGSEFLMTQALHRFLITMNFIQGLGLSSDLRGKSKKEQNTKITRQLTSNRALKKALENPDTRAAIIATLEESLAELQNKG